MCKLCGPYRRFKLKVRLRVPSRRRTCYPDYSFHNSSQMASSLDNRTTPLKAEAATFQ